MDNILERHLAAALLLPQESLSIPEISENIIPYHSYKNVDNSNYFRLSTGLVRTETIGYWKNKPVFLYNDEEYVLLENSKTIVKTDSLKITKDQITKDKDEPILPLINKIVESIKQDKKNKIVKKEVDPIDSYLNGDFDKKQEESVEEPKQELEKEPEEESEEDFSVLAYLGKAAEKPKQEVKQEEPAKEDNKLEEPDNNGLKPIPTNQSTDIIGAYLKNLKDEDSLSNTSDKDPSDDAFSAKNANKEDERLKKLFDSYLEQSKQELYALNEKFTQQQMQRVFESGGGTNTMQYYKRIYTIGNDIDTDYVIDHQLGTKDLFVSLYQDDEIILAYVKNINENQTLICFNKPQSNIKVVIMG
jgi:hypothetical protein